MWGAVAFVLLSLAIFSVPMFDASAPILTGRMVPGFQARDIAWMGVGSAGLILSSMAFARLSDALCSRPIAYLGRISVSLYLLHKTFLHLLVPVFAPYDGALPIVFLYVALIAVSIIASGLAYEFVEKPSIRIGRWASRRIVSESRAGL